MTVFIAGTYGLHFVSSSEKCSHIEVLQRVLENCRSKQKLIHLWFCQIFQQATVLSQCQCVEWIAYSKNSVLLFLLRGLAKISATSCILQISKIEDTKLSNLRARNIYNHIWNGLGSHTLTALVGVGDVIALLLKAHQKVINLLHVLRGCQVGLHSSWVCYRLPK